MNVSLWAKLFDHGWDETMAGDLRSWASGPNEVTLNLVDLKFDGEFVTVSALWAEGDGEQIPEDTVSRPVFLAMVDARASGNDWRAARAAS